MISGRGVVEIWKGSILGGVSRVVGSCGGVSGMVLVGAGCLGGLGALLDGGMGFLWVTRLGVGDGSSRLDVIFVQPIPSKFRANDTGFEYIETVATVFREEWPIGQFGCCQKCLDGIIM